MIFSHCLHAADSKLLPLCSDAYIRTHFNIFQSLSLFRWLKIKTLLYCFSTVNVPLMRLNRMVGNSRHYHKWRIHFSWWKHCASSPLLCLCHQQSSIINDLKITGFSWKTATERSLHWTSSIKSTFTRFCCCCFTTTEKLLYIEKKSSFSTIPTSLLCICVSAADLLWGWMIRLTGMNAETQEKR